MRPLLALLLPAALAPAADFPRFTMQELDPHVGNVCYAVTVADVNADGLDDIVALTEDAIVWFAAPNWEKHVELKGATERDNVCIQPHDIDGDGRVDFAVGAAWRPADTQGGGTLQWVKPRSDGPWEVHPIASEPTLHRLRWGDVTGDGKKELVVAPLQGRGTKGPNWGDGQGVRILVYTVPKHPTNEAWPVEVADDSLHTVHNLQLLNWDDDPADEILLCAWEGVFLLDRASDGRWTRTQLGSGNQEAAPFKGASEIKLGRLAGGARYIATVEPWHGFQVVAYSPAGPGELWTRRVIDEPVAWGHAVWTANLDADADDELLIGQRDPNKNPAPGVPAGPGLMIYDPIPGSSPLAFRRIDIDPGGVAVEDALAADLNGDGLLDLVAGGRATHNLRVYWQSRP